MSKTSSAVKNRYNAKTYTPWRASLKKDYFAEVEELRKSTGLSRPEFLQMLVDIYLKKEFEEL